MSRGANLSPLGLFSWDKTLFDLFVIPTALSKDTLIDNLLAETAELEVLYPNPVVMKNLIGVWSRKNLEVWQKLWETTQYDYNPIENYNRIEEGTQGGTGRTTHSGTDTTTDHTTYGGTDTRSENIQEGGTQGESSTGRRSDSGTDATTAESTKGHWVAGFDSQASGDDDGLVKQTRDEDSTSTSVTYGKVESGTGSQTTTFGKTEAVTENKTYGQTVNRTGATTHGEAVTNTNEGTHTLHARGNIGVTTTQEMIQQERSVDRFNLYDIIIEEFKMRFCILIY